MLSLPCVECFKGKLITHKRKNSPPLREEFSSPSPFKQNSLRGPEGSSWVWTPALPTWQEVPLREQSSFVLESGLNHNPDADWRWPWLWWEEGAKKDGAFVSQEEKGQADWVRSPVPFGN